MLVLIEKARCPEFAGPKTNTPITVLPGLLSAATPAPTADCRSEANSCFLFPSRSRAPQALPGPRATPRAPVVKHRKQSMRLQGPQTSGHTGKGHAYPARGVTTHLRTGQLTS